MRSSGASARPRVPRARWRLALVGRDRLGGGHGGLLERGRVTEPLALHLERVLVTGLEDPVCPRRALQLGEPPGRSIGIAGELLVAAAGGHEFFHAPAASRLRSNCSIPQNASSTSSWNDGRARRRCSNWPDIASSRSAAAATSSRATARPQAYARVRPPRRRDARARALPRPRVAAPRAWPCRPRRRTHQARRAPPPRRPRSRQRRRTTRPRAHLAASRSPARRSSSPLRSRP